VRTRLILGSLILGISFSAQSLLGEAPKASLNLRQQFDSEISNLQRNLKAFKKPEERWTAIQKTESQIKELRAASPLQVDPDEIYMDLVSSSLKAIPRKTDFNKQDCEVYRTSILAQFDPKDNGKVDAPVAQALTILDLLCQK
jgi:hypothetical protein